MQPLTLDEEAIFKVACQIPYSQARAAYLREACGGQQPIMDRITRLLEIHERDSGFLKSPPPGIDAVQEIAKDAATETSCSERIGPYKLLQPIGEGGMGVVYLAEQTEPVQRKVAVKVIKPGMDSRQVIARFEAERQALALMDHPNIAKVLDAGTTPAGQPYFVMELVKGQPITQYCDDNRLTLRQRLELFIPICQAIQHAHHKGLIHRDIKPSNILIAPYDGRPVVKVIDFGVAKATGQQLTEKTLFTQFGAVLGTLEYMSPEQAELNNQDIDTRSDIYSLGVLLYELLTGATPLDRERTQAAAFDEVLRIIREDEPERPSTRLSQKNRSLPTISAQRQTEPAQLARLIRGELDWIVMRALEKDRARRYETANGLAMDIQRYLNDEQVAACPPTAAYRLRKFARRNKGLMATTGVVTAALVLGLLAASWQAIRATRAERIAIAERDAKETARRQALASAETARAAAASERKAKEAEAEQRKKAEQAEKTAAEEAEAAKAVTDFLQHDLLSLAGVENQMQAEIVPDPDLKLVTLLHRARGTVATRFADQPRTRAEVQAVLGEAFFAIGRYSDAIQLQQQVLQFRESTLGAEHPATLDAMNALGISYQYLGNSSEAESLYSRALEASRRVLGREDPQTLVLMNNLANLRQRFAHKRDEAARLQAEHLAIASRVLGPKHPSTLTSMQNLAGALHAQGKYADAEALFTQVMEMERVAIGAEHPKTLVVMNNLACLYRDQGMFAKASPIFAASLTIRRRIYGPEHPETLVAIENLADCYRSLARFADAEPLFLELLELLRRKRGDSRTMTRAVLEPLVQIYLHMGKRTEARELVHDNLSFLQSGLQPNSPELANALAESGLLLLQCESWSEAEKVLGECLDIRRKTEPDAWTTFSAQSMLGGALFEQARRLLTSDPARADEFFARARPLLVEGYEEMRRLDAPGIRLNEALQRLLEFYVFRGEFQEIVALQSELGRDTAWRALWYLDACWRKSTMPASQAEQAPPDALATSLQPALALHDLEIDFQHAAWLAATGRVDEYQSFVGELWRRPRDPANPRQAYLLARLSLLTETAPSNAGEVLDVARAAAAEPLPWHLFTLALALVRTGDHAGALELLPPISSSDWCWGLSAMVRALALQGLGRHDEARSALERGRQWCEYYRIDVASSLNYHDRMHGVLLRREAEARLSLSTPSPQGERNELPSSGGDRGD